MNSTGTDVLEEGLRGWAQGVYWQEAAVELLIRTGWTRRQSFLSDVVIDDQGGPGVDWDRLGQILDGEQVSGILAASGGELRVLRLAHSLAAGDLGSLLPGRDRNAAALVPVAVAHANGSHEHSGEPQPDPHGPCEDQAGTRFSVAAPGSLHPWPPDLQH